MGQYDLMLDLKIKVGQCNLYFMVQWFCLISWRLFDVLTWYLGIMSQYDLMLDLEIKVGHWPLFHGSLILPYILKKIWCINMTCWNNESVWLDAWPQNKSGSLWPICHGSLILPYILKTNWCINMTCWNNESVWLDAWPQNKSGSLWPICHGSMILPYILKTNWCINMITWNNESVWLDSLPQNKTLSLWPIFHGSLILPYILKTNWCINMKPLANESVWLDVWPQNKSESLWPISHGSLILAYILKTIWCIRRWHWPGIYVSLCSLALVRAAVACAILERTSGLEPSSETTAPMYLKLVTVPNFCPFTFISLWMPLVLFVFSALISILYLVQVLLRLSTRAFISCSSSARASMSSANRRLVIFLPPMLTFPSCFSRASDMICSEKCWRGWVTEDILALLRLLFWTILLCCHSFGLHL